MFGYSLKGQSIIIDLYLRKNYRICKVKQKNNFLKYEIPVNVHFKKTCDAALLCFAMVGKKLHMPFCCMFLKSSLMCSEEDTEIKFK